MKPASLASLLALGSLFLSVLLPPEAYPEGKLAVIVASTFVFFTSLMERRVNPSYVWWGLAAFAGLLVHSVFVSVDAYRSVEFLSVLWIYYCLGGFFLYSGFSPLRPVALAVVGMSILVSVYGIYQYFWGFQELHAFVTSSSSGEVLKERALARIADQRVFSTFALPGTLWGFLVLALPLHAALWSRNRLWNTALAVSASLVLATGFLTRSFGFLVGLLVLAAAWLLVRHRRLLWNKLAIVLVLLVFLGGTFYSVRKEVISGSNPVSLRFMNWVSAWSIFAANPAGTGLNTYGVAYSRHMLPNANETQYSHNTVLQLLAELGYPLLIVTACGVVFLISRRKPVWPAAVSPWVWIALAVWLAHNLVDINVYFPSVGVFGAVLLAIAFWREPREFTPSVGLRVAVAIIGAVVMIFAGLVTVSTELQTRAQGEFDENRLTDAAATLATARTLMPINSSLHYDEGNVLLHLYHRRKTDELLRGATASFRRAIELSPEKAGPYSGLALCLSSANQVDAALEQIFLAQQRYPDSSELQAIRNLLTKRRLAGDSASAGNGGD